MREIELKPSRLLGLLLLIMAGLALVSIHLAAMTGVVQLVLSGGVIGLTAWGGWQARVAETIRLKADGQLQFQEGDGAWCDVEVLGDSLVSTALIVLRYRRADGRARSLSLLPDSADAESLRRLRVSLRWARHTRSDTSNPDAG